MPSKNLTEICNLILHFTINELSNSDIDSEDLQCDMSLIVSIMEIDDLNNNYYIDGMDYGIGSYQLMLVMLESTIDNTSNSDFKESLRNFIDPLPNIPEIFFSRYSIFEKEEDIQEQEQWEQLWEQNGNKWSEELREIAIKYRDLGHDWQFSEEQERKLKKYIDANKLLWEWIEIKQDSCY